MHTRRTSIVLATLLASACVDEPRDTDLVGGGGEMDGDTDDGDGDDGDDGSDGNEGTDGHGGDGATDEGDDNTEGGGETNEGDGDDDTGGPDTDPDLGSCSRYADAAGFFGLINSIRADYGGEGIYLPHSRYKGLPWEGEGHEDWTFSTQFSWDDGLAQVAQAEAERLAAGGNPSGTQVSGQAAIHNPFWIDGVNTASWMITAWEEPGDWVQDPNNPFSSDVPFALDKSNGSARQGLHYHDFGGDGPAIHYLGVGGALTENADGSCRVWWVLQFGP